jgi:calcium-dependent protein kinase
MIANIDPAQLIQEDKLREIFEIFDVDKSGTITMDELKNVLGRNNKGKGNEIDETEWERMVAEVDIDGDGDGEISFLEFKYMIFNLLNIPCQFLKS